MLSRSATSFRRRLLAAENQFLAVRDTDALAAFDHTWSCLCDELEHALEIQQVDASLLPLMHSIASRIATLGEDLMSLDREANSMTSAYLDELEDMFANLTLDSRPPPSPAVSSLQQLRKVEEAHSNKNFPNTPSSTLVPPSATPPFLEPAYSWIIRNIHNPYPSGATKRALAKSSGVSYRTMDDWFKSMRRSIGWVSLCKKRFNGSRSLTIATAKRVFGNGGDLDLPPDVATELLLVKLRLDNIYANGTPCAGPSTPRQTYPAALLSSTKSVSVGQSWPTVVKEHHHQVVDATHSPRIVARPPPLIFSSDTEDEDKVPEIPSIPFAGGVVVWPGSEICYPEIELHNCPLVKRERTPHSISYNEWCPTLRTDYNQSSTGSSSPLTPTDFDWWCTTPEMIHTVVAPSPISSSSPFPASSTRKRRNSDSGQPPPSKRIKAAHKVHTPRHTAVSNFFPMNMLESRDLLSTRSLPGNASCTDNSSQDPSRGAGLQYDVAGALSSPPTARGLLPERLKVVNDVPFSTAITFTSLSQRGEPFLGLSSFHEPEANLVSTPFDFGLSAAWLPPIPPAKLSPDEETEIDKLLQCLQDASTFSDKIDATRDHDLVLPLGDWEATISSLLSANQTTDPILSLPPSASVQL